MTPETVCIACSIFTRELETLKKERKIDCSLFFLDSLLHLQPQLLNRTLTPLIRRQRSHGNAVVLVYGDCHPFMDKVAADLGSTRTPGQNCCEILLGTKEYKKRIREGAFFLLPEWVLKWENIFQSQMGLKDKQTARSFMGSMHTHMLYLDTGLQEIPHDVLTGFSEYCGLPVRFLTVDLDHFLQNILHVTTRGDT